MPQPRSLPSEITIYTLSALHSQWQDWLPRVPSARRSAALRDTSWPVDASEVDEIDAAGVQLLLSLAHSMTLRRRTLRLINPSRSLTNACEALGVSMLLAANKAEEVRT